jgi:transcriptional regulator with PAS, ATPase and Fis domain
MNREKFDRDMFDDEAYKDKEILYDLYWEKKLPTTKMAGLLGVSKKTVLNWMRRHDIDRRGRRRPWATYSMVNGYMRWTVSVGDGTKSMDVARLLAISEYGTEEVKNKDVHHTNGITWLNTPENIELKNRSDHSSHHNKGEDSSTAKLTESEVKEIKEKIRKRDNLAPIGKEYGVSRQTIYDIRDGRSWSNVEI